MAQKIVGYIGKTFSFYLNEEGKYEGYDKSCCSFIESKRIDQEKLSKMIENIGIVNGAEDDLASLG